MAYDLLCHGEGLFSICVKLIFADKWADTNHFFASIHI